MKSKFDDHSEVVKVFKTTPALKLISTKPKAKVSGPTQTLEL